MKILVKLIAPVDFIFVFVEEFLFFRPIAFRFLQLTIDFINTLVNLVHETKKCLFGRFDVFPGLLFEAVKVRQSECPDL